jgi:hypothetical protein
VFDTGCVSERVCVCVCVRVYVLVLAFRRVWLLCVHGAVGVV